MCVEDVTGKARKTVMSVIIDVIIIIIIIIIITCHYGFIIFYNSQEYNTLKTTTL